MERKTNAKLYITGNELLNTSRDLASKLGLAEKSRTPAQAELKDFVFNGRIEVHNPRIGLHIYALDVRLGCDVDLLVDMERPATVVSLVLAGSCRQRIQRSNDRELVVEFKTGSNVISNFHAERSRFELAGGQNHRIVDLHFDPTSFQSLIDPGEAALANPLPPMFFKARGSRLNVETPLPYGLETIARQILDCPFQGISRQLFMESKALEILALELDAFSQAKSPEGGLSAQELRRLDLARHILDEQFDDPPSILELSRKVGLNDFKLKRGFRQAFSTTVFGYVRRLRMEKARALLESGSINVTEAAVTTGYSCLSHFTAAFKKHFGFLPSDVLRK